MDFSERLAPYSWIWWCAAFLYNPAIVGLQQIAPALKPWRGLIRQAWGVWNLCFATLSFCGLAATVKVFLAVVVDFPQLCRPDSTAASAFWNEHITGPVYSWVLWFLVSKLFELGDTIFLAALERPVAFLHWYQHLTMLAYCFIGALKWHPHMMIRVAWNYGVHAVMCAFNVSACYGIKWPIPLVRSIKTLQLVQMLAELTTLVASCWFCGFNYHISFWPSVTVFVVSTCLLADMFRQRYINRPSTARQETVTQTGTGKAKTVTQPWQSYVTIDGYDYDVTDFQRKHPGGGVIRHYIGLDATAAFKEFHSTSNKAGRLLHSLPRRRSACAPQPALDADCAPASSADTTKAHSVDSKKAQGDVACRPDYAPSDDAAIMADFAAWRDSLESRGLFKPRPAWQLLCFLFEPVMLVAAAAWVMRSTGSTMLGVLLLSLASTRTGWIQHEGGHNSLTRNNKVDKILQTFANGLGLSMSGWVWNSMHNKHHATPNKINFDIDLNTLPLVAFYKGCVEKDKMARGVSKPLLYKWLRGQAYTFLPVTCMAVSVLWFTFLHPIKAWKKDKLGLAVMAVSQVARPALFVVFGGTTFLQGFLLNMLSFWITSMYMFGHFALSHTFMPVVEEHDNPSWVRFAMEHSTDISPGNWAVDWIMGYLNYQVIHHLFPSMPQCYGPIVSQELRLKAKEWGINYATMPYFAAWRAMLANLDAVGAHYYAADTIKKVA